MPSQPTGQDLYCNNYAWHVVKGIVVREAAINTPCSTCATGGVLAVKTTCYAVIGQQDGRKAGLHVGLSRGQVDGSC